MQNSELWRLVVIASMLALACNGEVNDPGETENGDGSTGDTGTGDTGDTGDDDGTQDGGVTEGGDSGTSSDGGGTTSSAGGTSGSTGGSTGTSTDTGGAGGQSVACTGPMPADACDLDSQVCCTMGMNAACEPAGGCNDTEFACDGPEDCNGGVCCFDFYSVDQGGSWCAASVGDCGAVPPACHEQSDCDSGSCMAVLQFTPWWMTCQ